MDLVFLDELAGRAEQTALIELLRAASRCGIIVIAAEPADEQLIDLLDAGADDYLGASFSPAQLVARVGALLRRIKHRAEGEDERILRCGPLYIRPNRHQAEVSGQELRLSTMEFRILYHLAAARGGVITSRVLQRLLWGSDEPYYMEPLRRHVRRLRAKLRRYREADLDIAALRGVGYRLVSAA